MTYALCVRNLLSDHIFSGTVKTMLRQKKECDVKCITTITGCKEYDTQYSKDTCNAKLYLDISILSDSIKSC